LFGPEHHLLRDITPSVILPAAALGLSYARLRDRHALDGIQRRLTLALMALIGISIAMVVGYAALENAADVLGPRGL